MDGEIIIRKQQELGQLGFVGVPAITSAAGDRASFRFIEFITANIRNQNTLMVVKCPRKTKPDIIWKAPKTRRGSFSDEEDEAH